MRHCARCWGRGQDTVPALWSQAPQWCVFGWGRVVDSLVSNVLSAKKMLSSGLEDFVVHLLSVKSRRWMVTCKNGINHWTLSCRLLDGNPLRASKHSTNMPMCSFKNASQSCSSPCTYTFLYILQGTSMWTVLFAPHNNLMKSGV